MPKLRHLLVVRTDHLGDMLLTLPMVHAVKAAQPACRVTVLASAANAEAARHHPAVDAVAIDPREAKGSGLRGVGPLARQIRALGCDAAVIVHPTPRLALAVYLAGVPLRVGTAYRAYSFLFNRRVHEHRRRPPQKHESEYNLNLLQPLDINPPAATQVTWEVGAAESAVVVALLRVSDALDAQLVVLHPGSGGSAMNWSPAQYGDLGRRLASHRVRIAVTGSAQETALTAQVATAIGAAALDFGGRLNLPELAALLARSALVVGSSTGPTHLAAALGTPVVALYPPLRSSNPQRWRPLGPRVRVLQPSLDLVCPRCLGARCPYYHCMEKHLTVETVEAAARQVLERRHAAAPAPR
ncbi:MAG TPA: glycosyltransferase family 9 protein [Candidatus Acidoferrales bacterium]|nr:glycosyltransferase family 9 protein [Candidatus Acidoferrales bacterium]